MVKLTQLTIAIWLYYNILIKLSVARNIQCALLFTWFHQLTRVIFHWQWCDHMIDTPPSNDLKPPSGSIGNPIQT